jgi:hypothetical protein
MFGPERRAKLLLESRNVSFLKKMSNAKEDDSKGRVTYRNEILSTNRFENRMPTCFDSDRAVSDEVRT